MPVVAVLFALFVSEVALRAIRFEFRFVPKVQFGYPDPTTLVNRYVSDPDVFWVTPRYRTTLEAARRSPPAIVFMGDSCTEFGSYPRRTLDLLAKRAPDLSAGIKLGVAGWSSYQGLAQLKRDIVPLRPRVVTIYFGWNDHWVALGPPDDQVRPPDMAATGFGLWLWFLDHTRLAQLVYKWRVGSLGPLTSRPNRVDLPQYRSNLESMIHLARGAQIVPVLITAASNHVANHEPDAEILRQRYLRNISDLVPMHQAYVDATRDVARTTGAALCDAAAAFETLPQPRRKYFWKDGIHLTDEGNQALADVLAPCIERAVKTGGP